MWGLETDDFLEGQAAQSYAIWVTKATLVTKRQPLYPIRPGRHIPASQSNKHSLTPYNIQLAPMDLLRSTPVIEECRTKETMSGFLAYEGSWDIPQYPPPSLPPLLSLLFPFPSHFSLFLPSSPHPKSPAASCYHLQELLVIQSWGLAPVGAGLSVNACC